ncbi:MAG TPA: Plug domain-containing protein, partial [Longimicrobium sp.]|nr:Plug domain-containing protein [Longimicrobium sp.]
SLGMGVFLDSAVVAERSRGAIYPADVLRGVPGLRLRHPGGRSTVAGSVRGWGCMVTLVDGHPMTFVYPREMHHFMETNDVLAVEVYREFSEVPEEFRIHAHSGIFPCGVIAYWTRVRW